jgi:glyoxylase-like metal-dependent hydrolase (beta-lactamase superfamily II)
MNKIIINRRNFFSTSVSLLSAFTISRAGGTLIARTPPAGAQVSGIYRIRIGDFEVTALLDGFAELDLGAFRGAKVAEIERMLKNNFVSRGPRHRLGITAYLVNTGSKLVLIDAGTANLYGPTAGRLSESLKAAKVTVQDIDAVLLTHLHADHFGGLMNGGARTFPNASVYAPAQDLEFFINESHAMSAPEYARPWFAAARQMTELYPKIEAVHGSAEVFSGISSFSLPGHTPGHQGFMITSNGEKLFIVGDIVFSPALNFQNPEIGIAFDHDAERATASRRLGLEEAAAGRLLIAATHLPFPTFGYVAKTGDAFAFHPAEWSFDLT